MNKEIPEAEEKEIGEGKKRLAFPSDMQSAMTKAKAAMGQAVKDAKVKEKLQGFASGVQSTAITAADKTKAVAGKAQEAVLKEIDANGNNRIDIEDFIIHGLRLPWVHVDREDFLRKELTKRYPAEVVDEAVAFNPMRAGIAREDADKIADEVIKFERNCVTSMSAALGTPGGAAMIATIPADMLQYHGYMLRALQKLMYLYGFPPIIVSEKGQQFDAETMNLLVVGLGTMYGVAGANNALKVVARALGSGVEKKLLNTALTKGTIYPIVKSVAKWFNVKMTKDVFAGFFKKAIPLVGSAIGGGITFMSFKPCCDRLKNALRDTQLSNPQYHATQEERELEEQIETGVEVETEEEAGTENEE